MDFHVLKLWRPLTSAWLRIISTTASAKTISVLTRSAKNGGYRQRGSTTNLSCSDRQNSNQLWPHGHLFWKKMSRDMIYGLCLLYTLKSTTSQSWLLIFLSRNMKSYKYTVWNELHDILSQWMTCKFSCPLFWSYLSTFVDIVLHFWKKFRLPRSTSASRHTTRTPSCCNWSLWIGIQLAFSLQTPLQNGHLRFGPAVIQLFSFTL